MLLGYNQPRPTERNYQDFETKFVGGLRDLELDGLSLMIYGSFVRGDYNPGRSDIDAVMVFPDNVVIDKQNFRAVGKILHYALKDNNIPFQVSATDLSIMKDGRFNTYDVSFKDYFSEEGKIVVGHDYREDFRYEMPSMGNQIAVSFNLRKSRGGLLFAEHDMNEDYEIFLKKFSKTLDAISRGSKQILSFIDGKPRRNRFLGLELMQEVFPEIDSTPLERIKHLYSHLNELDNLYKKPDEVIALWEDSVTLFEQMIKGYMDKFPRN